MDQIYENGLFPFKEIDAIGTKDFYDVLLGSIQNIIGVDSAQIMILRSSGQPDYIATYRTPKNIMQLYRDSYYRECPMQHHWLSHDQGNIVSIKNAEQSGVEYRHYWKNFYKKTGLKDEFGIFISSNKHTTFVIFLERTEKFSQNDLKKINALFPIISTLHQNNIRLLMEHLVTSARKPNILSDAAVITDRFGHEITSNQKWKSNFNFRQYSCREIIEASLQTSAHPEFTVEPIGQNSNIANDGYLIQQTCKGTFSPTDSTSAKLIHFHSRFKLTPREKEIVKLMFEGKANTDISKILQISINTVKGHRKRLYAKLNITTEREFHLLVRDQF